MGAVASDEVPALGFIGGNPDIRVISQKFVQQDRILHLGTARPAFKQQSILIRQVCTADKHFAECRVPFIIKRRCQHHLRIGGKLNDPFDILLIRHGDMANFNIIARRHRCFHMRREAVFSPKHLHFVLVKDCIFTPARSICRAPSH